LKNAPVLARTIEKLEKHNLLRPDELKEVLARYLPDRVRNKILAQIYHSN
jgi:16S rRNA (cytosine1402-N4)-methyltransferase